MDAAKPMVVRAKACVGVDVGKEFQWAVVVDAEGEILLSRRVENEEADLSALVEEVLAVSGGELCWAVDQPGGGAALLLALLWGGDQRVLYIPGLAVDRVRDGFRGETKTDRREALVIAEQARMRRDLKPLEPADELLSELRLLLSHRRDLWWPTRAGRSSGYEMPSSRRFRAWSVPCRTCATGAPSSCCAATRHPARYSVPAQADRDVPQGPGCQERHRLGRGGGGGR